MAARDVVLSCISKAKILKWHIKVGDTIKKEKILASYIFTEKVSDSENFIVQRKLKAKFNGKVQELIVRPNEEIAKGQVVAKILEDSCKHDTIMKDMCCDCGADLRRDPGVRGNLIISTNASVPVVHNILELKVSAEEAERLARYDEQQLLRARKLVLVVDLDMTLIHTTVEPVCSDTEDVLHFTLPGHQYEYHTKLRPGARKFLESISKFYELHIFTMGSRMYAHTIAKYLDPEGKFFAHRIRSRDEFITSFSKFHDLKALFPCGDHMVCIIDDRDDVWNFAPNLIVVKPYKYFKGTEDINNPFTKNEANKNETQEDGVSNVATEGCAAPTVAVSAESSASTSCLETKSADEKASTGATENLQGENEMNKETAENLTSSKSDSTTNGNSVKVATKTSVDDTSALALSNNGKEKRLLHTDLDDYLFYLDEILERVHFSFYSTLDKVKTNGGTSGQDQEITKFCTYRTINPDTRVILPELRRQTLKGANIVFTGVIPTKTPLENSRAWRTAVSLGARVTSDIVLKKTASAKSGLFTTHVVAARHGTHKAHIGYKSPDIQLVHPNWLWCASERWEWPEEGIFPVPIVDNAKSPVASRQGTPQHHTFEGKSKRQISPLAKEGFELPGGYDPDNFLEELSFTKQELDAMDKEVEELMGDTDTDDEVELSEANVLPDSNQSSSSKRKASESSTDNSADDEETSMGEKLRKKLVRSVKRIKREQNDDNDSRYSSSTSSSDSSSDDENHNGEIRNDGGNSSELSSGESGSSSLEGEDEQMGNLLERQISEVDNS